MGDIINNKPEENSSDIIPPPSPPPLPSPSPWGTLEELLLVSSVNRHGSHNWVSVADELHKRPSTFLKHVNPDDCRIKYHRLRRRFNALAHHDDDDDDDDDPHQLLLLLQQLRNLRVQQLKRDLLQHDLSILSLQKKVKALEDEREKKNSGSLLSVKAETEAHEANPEALDLRTEAENANETAEPEKQRGGDSTEDRSVNESNSNTNTNKREGQDPVERKGSGAGESKRENSINNDNNNKMKSKTRKQEEEQEQSEVQSSASLTKKKRRRIKGGGGVNSSGDELEGEELSVSVSVSHSPANKLINVKSQPLIRFLDFLRSHKHASVFHRRLPTQETEKFRNVVRQHMDLDMVHSRLDRGIYNESHPKFYRDLLLIFTNAILFYRKSSPEHIASREMRKLVLNELNLRIPKPKVLPPKPEPDFQNLEPVVKKPRSSTTMVVCRRRSSIQGLSESMKKETSQQQHNVSGSIKNKMTTNNKVGSGSRSEEKAKGDQSQKKIDGSSSSNINVLSHRKDNGGDEGEGVANSSIKPLTKGQSSSLARGTLRMSNNNSKKIVSKDGSKREKTGNSGDNKEGSFKGSEGDEVTEKRKVNSDQKPEKASTTTVLKKQGVANFLKRIKQNSPSSQEKAKNNDSDDEEDDDDDEKLERKERTNSIGRKAGGNGRKNGNMGKEAVDVVVTRRTSGRKGEKEVAGSSRATGRPPKRKAAMMGGGTPDSGKRRKSGGGGGDEENSRKKSRR